MAGVYRGSGQFYGDGPTYTQKFRQGSLNKLRPSDRVYLATEGGAPSGAVNPVILVIAIVTVVAVAAATIGVSVYFSVKSDQVTGLETGTTTTTTILTTLAATTTTQPPIPTQAPTTTESPATSQPVATTKAATTTVTMTTTEPSADTTTKSATSTAVAVEDSTTDLETTSSNLETTSTETMEETTPTSDIESTTTEEELMTTGEEATTTEEEATTTEEEATTTMADTLGTWSEWAEYGSCDQTCGGGLQRRSRDCQDGQEGFYCVGSATSSQRCNTQPCPFEVTAGTWFPWTTWNDCTATCGSGAQVRSRSCDRGQLDLDCVGDGTQTQQCNDWTCPDCSVVCLSGTLSASCSHCECHGEFEGVVRSTAGVALSGVEISHSDAPFDILYTTGPSGNYSLEKLCVSHEIIFQKEGYISATYTADWLPNEVILEPRELLMMDLNPTSKKRIVGDNVLFCCAAIGNPSPEYYEWFKNDVQILNESGSTLSLTSVSLESAGSYRCRANTATQGVYSTYATLTIKENADDFCPDSPESKFQQLPSGCTVNEDTIIDVGQCDSLRCRGNGLSNQTCSDPETFCCAATEFESETLNCDGFTYTVYKAVVCGCSVCTAAVVDIQGFVFAATDNTPLESVDIYHNKTVVAKTASNGQFYFSMPEGTRTVSITARSPSALDYADTTTVLTLEEDADGVYYVSLKLPSLRALAPVESTMDQTIELKTEADTKLVDIQVPANSFFDEDGNLYQGQVTPYVSVIDPRDIKQLESAPGDFTTADGDGATEPLQTYGMMQLSFYADDGTKLQIVNEVQLQIPPAVLGTVDDGSDPQALNPLSAIKLYTFNPDSGLWEELASVEAVQERRKKRQSSYYSVNVTGIASSQPWFNFDAVSATTCHSKIRVYENENFLEGDQIRRVRIYAFINGTDGTYSYSTRIAYDNNDINGYCIIHRCDRPDNGNQNAGFEGFLVAEKDGKYLVPAWNNTGLDDLVDGLEYVALEDKIQVNFDMTVLPDPAGPFYNWERKWPYSPNCTSAPITDRHFRFHLQKEDQCHQFQGHRFREALTETCRPQYYKSWYSAGEIRDLQYTTCYVRVKIAQYTNDVKVQALSGLGSLQYNSSLESIQVDDIYGFHENCTVGGVVCSKVKPPGARGCSTLPQHDLQDLFTDVSIIAWYKDSGLRLNASIVNADLNNTYSIVQFGSTFAFEMAASDSVGGVFCETRSGTSPTESDIAAFSSCMEADDEDFAVQFGTSIDCFGELIVILNPNIKTEQESESSNLDWILEIVEDLPIGPENVRLSLTLLQSPQNVLWNLTSQYTASNENLYNALNDFPTDEANNGTIDTYSVAGINTVTVDSREGVQVVVIAFDYSWKLEQANITSADNDFELLKVVPYSERGEQYYDDLPGNSSYVDPDLFSHQEHTKEDFISALKNILQCNIP